MGVAMTEAQKPGTSKVKRKRAQKRLQSNDDGDEFQERASYIIHPNYYNDVLKILKNKKKQYGINDKLELTGSPDGSIRKILSL